MKFGTNKALTQTDVELKNIDEASKSSPLAQELFSFPFVKEIFISENYISIMKYDMVEWNEVYHDIRAFIRNYLLEGKTIISKLPEIKKETTEENMKCVMTSLREIGSKGSSLFLFFRVSQNNEYRCSLISGHLFLS